MQKKALHRLDFEAAPPPSELINNLLGVLNKPSEKFIY